MKRIRIRALAALVAMPGAAWAGPPYVTDDPQPTDLGHWEIYAFGAAEGAHGSWDGAAGLDLNYGGLPGVQLTEMPNCEHCCGFGGTFSVKYGDISTAIVDEKCAGIRASGADAVVLGDLGCMLNIEGRLRRTGDSRTRVLHIAQVLAGAA